MSDTDLEFANPPIVEAVLDIECDLPPGQTILSLEDKAKVAFRDQYPKQKTKLLLQHQIEQKANEQPVVSSSKQDVNAYQFLHQDECQLVQVRKTGYSFNRLAPYTKLDNYLPEINRTWELYRAFAIPLQIRHIQLRYINLIHLPSAEGKLNTDDFLKVGPRLPDEKSMSLLSFLNQYAAIERSTGYQVRTVLTAQAFQDGILPVIFDTTVLAPCVGEPRDWDWILGIIQALRGLKNRVFRDTLTPQCLNLFQRP